MNNTALEVLSEYKKIVWPEVNKYLKDPIYPDSFKIPKEYSDSAKIHWQSVKEYPGRQGKYLRPVLLMLTAEAMGIDKSKALKTAAAMQISEEWLLIHDDFEDGSIIRRGKPALHIMFNPELAVNAGDALHILMWKVLKDNVGVLGEKKTFELIEEFHKILMRTVLGQAVEIDWFKSNREKLSEKDWYFIADGKTSYYTIAGPMRLGAIIANADSVQLGHLAEFGKYLGRCFQLTDDILDITSDFKGQKQKGNDIYEGKRTVILGHLLENADDEDREKLLKILEKNREDKSKDEVNWVIGKMEEHGSTEHTRKLAGELKKKALDMFNRDLKFLSNQPARDRLEELIHFVLERDH